MYIIINLLKLTLHIIDSSGRLVQNTFQRQLSNSQDAVKIANTPGVKAVRPVVRFDQPKFVHIKRRIFAFSQLHNLLDQSSLTLWQAQTTPKFRQTRNLRISLPYALCTNSLFLTRLNANIRVWISFMLRESLELVSKSECKLVLRRNHASPRTSLILLLVLIQASTTPIPLLEELSDRATK